MQQYTNPSIKVQMPTIREGEIRHVLELTNWIVRDSKRWVKIIFFFLFPLHLILGNEG